MGRDSCLRSLSLGYAICQWPLTMANVQAKKGGRFSRTWTGGFDGTENGDRIRLAAILDATKDTQSLDEQQEEGAEQSRTALLLRSRWLKSVTQFSRSRGTNSRLTRPPHL